MLYDSPTRHARRAPQPAGGFPRVFPARWLHAVAALLLLAGCRSGLDVSDLRNDPLTEEMTKTDGIMGPIERMLNREKGTSGLGSASLPPTEGLADYEAAERLFKAGEYQQAEKAGKAIAKKYKNTQLREDALFLVAEAQFMQQKYSWAQDSYERLVKEYPSTRYLDTFAKRQFEIARTWLQSPQIVTSADVAQVNYEDVRSTPAPKIDVQTSRDPSRLVPILPNFFDRSRPWFDTNGRALEALKSIWLNDPTGPLADDALMLTASYYMQKEDYLEADRIYGILREQYPKSPHLENAYILGSHAKVMAYDGPMYDGRALDEARQLKESTLRLYPNHPQADRLRDEIRRIDEAKARQIWADVEFYQRKRNPRAVALACQEILDKLPQTSYADRARQTIAQLPQDQIRGLVDPNVLKGPAAAPAPAPTPQEQYDEPPGRVQF